MLSALKFSHELLNQLIIKFPNGNFIDCTLGNGHDTFYILNHSLFMGKLYGFDIQELAIINTHEKIKNLPKYNLFQSHLNSHSEIDTLLPHVNIIHGSIFNLGYLPGSNHKIATQHQTTIIAIKHIMKKLIIGGQIILVVYWGHAEGKIEKEYLEIFLQQVNQNDFSVASFQLINQKNFPPQLFLIEKIN